MLPTDELKNIFEKWSREKVKSFSPLPESGSSRKYYRISGESKNAIGAFNPDLRENKAFIYLSKHFVKVNLNVPKIYSADLKNNIYIQEDLGNQTLFSLLEQTRIGDALPDEVITLYKTAIEQLPVFQVTASNKLDYTKCYPRAKFDKQSMLWDLNYFKYYFLKLANISFDEQKLEDDFNTLTTFLLKADCNYFLYRDFNSRNIMIKNSEPYFIDYQGGRKGALQYDIASLLLDSKANIPVKYRQEFLEAYLISVSHIKKINKKEFIKYLNGYALIRLLQMFGAYGYRGYFEGKAHFLKSIPFAISNLELLFNTSKIKSNIKLKELYTALDKIISSRELKRFGDPKPAENKLTVHVNSFSYRGKIPQDLTGNGGGFVFDCRAIPNPGRYEEYKSYNGTDKNVQDFLDAQPDAQSFLKDTINMIDKTVTKYIANGWTNLMVNYGCTGGQHRSVYCALKLAEHLSSKHEIIVRLRHIRLESNRGTK
jgi:aminoglycoside/choline kinase family phosphotransferase